MILRSLSLARIAIGMSLLRIAFPPRLRIDETQRPNWQAWNVVMMHRVAVKTKNQRESGRPKGFPDPRK